MYQWFTAGFPDVFLVKLLNMSITASIIIVAVIGVRCLLRRAPKIFSYMLWGIVLFRLLCPFSFSFRFSALRLLDQAKQEQTVVQTQSGITNPVVNRGDKSDAVPAVNRNQIPALTPAQDPEFTAYVKEAARPFGERSATENFRNEEKMLTLLYGMWGAGVVVLFSVNMVTLWRLRRKTAACLQLRGNVYLCDQVDTPCCMGVFRPKIYLPSSLGEREREYILLHEKHHIRRGDHVMKLLAFLTLCLHWFNPLAWVAFVLAGKDMEMSCDEAVMKQMEGDIRKEYSLSLLQLATGKRVFVATGLSFGEGNPKQRIRNIMNYRKPGLWVVVVAIIGCIVTAVVLTTNPKEKPEDMDNAVVSSGEQEVPSGSADGESPEMEQPGDGTTDGDGQESSDPAGEDSGERLAAYYELLRKAEEAIYDPQSNGDNYEAYLDAEGNPLFSWEVTRAYDGSNGIAYQNIGYLIQDINGDGVEELLLGENDPHPNGGYNGIIYDLYTYRNHQPVHVFQGWNRSRYYLTEEGIIAREWAASASEGDTEFYEYDGTQLVLLEEQKALEEYHYVYPVFNRLGPFWTHVGDLDGDASDDYVISTGRDGIYNHLALYLAGEGIIFEHEDPLPVDLGKLVCSVDIDHDGEDEILLTMWPHVNSAGLEEYAVLKKVGDTWEKLEMYHEEGDILANSFPLSLVRGEGKWEAQLSCKGLSKTAAIDLEPHYNYGKDQGEQGYYEDVIANAKAGQDIGGISAWGIWDIELSSFAGQPCLVATQGIEGFDKHQPWGLALIYFDYDQNGKIRVLDLIFEPENYEAEAD